MAHRIDKGTLKPAQRRADGTVVVDTRPTRAGVFQYMNADGSVRNEWRPMREVFNTDSLASLNLRPVTNDHPPTMVTAGNARMVTVGTTGQDARRDAEFVAASLVVYDAEAIADMEAGKRELSCGYECDIIAAPGVVPAGEPDAGVAYDTMQANIRYNHVAIVDRGRAGSQCVARLDAAIMQTAAERGIESRKDTIMTPEQIAALMQENAGNKVRADNAERENATLREQLAAAAKRADAADSARAAAEGARDAAVRERTDSEASIAKRVADRVKLEAIARSVGVKCDGLEDRALKCAVVKKIDGVDIADTESPAFVDGRFASAAQRADKSAAALDSTRRAAEDAREQPAGGDDPEAAALAKLRADNAERYRNRGGNSNTPGNK